MQSEITGFPFSILKIKLNIGEQIIVEKGALLSYRGELEWITKVEARTFKHLALKIFGKSLTYNVFTAKTDAELIFAPSGAGDLLEIKLQPEAAYYISPGNHLARHGVIHFDAKIDSKAILSDNLRVMEVSGEGSVFAVAYGTLQVHELAAGETLVVDDGFLVAFEKKLGIKLQPFSVKRTLLSGEGLLVELTGPGKVYLQTRRKTYGQGSSGGVGSIIEAVSR